TRRLSGVAGAPSLVAIRAATSWITVASAPNAIAARTASGPQSSRASNPTSTVATTPALSRRVWLLARAKLASPLETSPEPEATHSHADERPDKGTQRQRAQAPV